MHQLPLRSAARAWRLSAGREAGVGFNRRRPAVVPASAIERGCLADQLPAPRRPSLHHRGEAPLLCWLALLLIRIAETTAGTTWNKITDELGQLTLGTFTGPAGTLRQTDLTPAQRSILAGLSIPSPKTIIQAAPAGP